MSTSQHIEHDRDMRTRLNFGVLFGEKHSYFDYGLFFCSKQITPPEPQTSLISVPGRNGVIDMSTSLTGSVKYKTRQITMLFRCFDLDYDDYPAKRSELLQDLQGQRLQIVFDDDMLYYYSGILNVSELKQVGHRVAELTITATAVQPYKYNRTLSDEDWLWDPFDFEDGVIPGTTVGTAPCEIELDADSYCESFTVTASGTVSNLVMTVGTKAFPLVSGKNKLYDVPLVKGTNTLTFTGSGNVSVSYRGGEL